MAYEELFTDLLRAEREKKTDPRYTFVVKGHFSKARSGASGYVFSRARSGPARRLRVILLP